MSISRARSSWVALGVLLLAGCGEPRPNVLLITVDALRPDHMSLYGYERPTSPNIDAFFAHGTIYDKAYATETMTGPSVASFLSGKLPRSTGVRVLYQKFPEDLELIPDHLSEVGYQTAAVVSNMVLTTEASGLDTHFDYYDDYVDQKEPFRKIFERVARGTTDAGLRWATETYDPSRPYFLWLHYQDTHGPYHPPADKPIDFTHDTPRPVDIDRIPSYTREPGIDDGLDYVDRYDEELAYADAQIGRLLKALEQQGMLENTIVIFSADHGESMMEHEAWFTHSYHVYDEIARVPLAFRYPGQTQQRRVPDRVSLVDLLPTLLDDLGLEAHEDLQGRSLHDGTFDRPLYIEGRDWRGMVVDDEKWLLRVIPSQPRPVPAGCYDLSTDPHELARLPWKTTPLASEFEELVATDPDPHGIPQEYAKGTALAAPKVRPGLDEETMEKLRALGYVE